MARTFSVSAGDILFQGALAAPHFSILDDDDLEPALFSALSSHGLQLAGMRFESGVSFADERIVCSLLSLATEVRVYLDRIEIHCIDVLKIGPTSFKALVAETLSALLRCRGVSFKTYVFAIGLHGYLEGLESKEFLREFTAAAPMPLRALGPLFGGGAVFYFGEEGQRVTAALTLDLSGTVLNGLFIRTQSLWNAEGVQPSDVNDLAQGHFNSVLRGLDLTIPT